MSSTQAGTQTAVSTQPVCLRLQGKVAIVTASTSGIGLAIAERLYREGAQVVISSRKQEHVDKALEHLRGLGIDVTGLVCNVDNVEQRKHLIRTVSDKFGGFDILVNNAAVNPHVGNILDTSEEAWDKIFSVNVKAAFMLCKEAIPHMEKRGGGAIVFVNSIAAYNTTPMIAPYAVSKLALLGLMKVLVPQCAEKNIRINSIAPGIIKTPFSGVLWKDQQKSLDTMYSFGLPLRRLGAPEECAGAVAFLVSNDASYITGENIVIAGGIPSHL